MVKKLFVGNLSFDTTEEGLGNAFSVAGKVVAAKIITRGRNQRSLGYGFVEMESEEDANKAIQQLNKKEIDGRAINVEITRERTEPVEDKTRPPRQHDEEGSSPRGGFRGRGRGGFRGRGRGGFRGRGRGGFRGGREGRGEGRGEGREGRDSERTPTDSREPREEVKRTPSKTMLFVSNLPFKLEDDGFAKMLTDAKLAFKAAHIVRRQRSGRSKGYGFIEFDNEADQGKALNSINKKVVDEREISVSIAYEKPPEPTANKQ